MNFILSILHHHYMFTLWSLCVHCMIFSSDFIHSYPKSIYCSMNFILSILYGHYMFTVRSLCVHCMIISRDISHSSLSTLYYSRNFMLSILYFILSLYFHFMVTMCSLYGSSQVTFNHSSLSSIYYSMNFLISILYGHYMFTVWSLFVHCMNFLK